MNSSIATRRAPKRSNLPGAAGTVLLSVSALGASSQSTQLEQELAKLHHYYAVPASSIRDRKRERFFGLTRRWREETQWSSSTTEIAMHPAYQAIIGMGPDALPLILQDLRENSGHWYWALKAISNEDPVLPIDRGAIKKMRVAWLSWGQAKGILKA